MPEDKDMFHGLRWRIALPYLLLILAAMLCLALYLSNLVRMAQLSDLEARLAAAARLIAAEAGPALAQGDTDLLDRRAREWAALLSARVTLIGADGTVLGESEEDRAQMDNHLYRPEVQRALAAGQGSATRYSRTLGFDMFYLAVPAQVGGQTVGVVRLALSLQQVEAHVAQVRTIVLAAALVVAVLSGLLALLLADRIARPVRDLTVVAERIVAGDLQARLFPSTRDEVGRLTLTFNRMADVLQQKLGALEQERSRLAAVLQHMADGVLFTDAAGQVLLLNPAAAVLLEAGEPGALGRTLTQVVRHHQLVELWQRCQQTGQEQSGLLEMGHLGRFLQVIVTPVQEAGAPAYLVILQDLTRLRQLERVRRDFVSNVSHELRTPLAAIRAAADTLRDGALDDRPAAERFVDKIEVEVNALAQLVEELLELARIESGQAPLRLQPAAVGDLLLPPVERLRPQAERAGLELRLEVPADLPPALADAERIRQVVLNLVHNAIKFTPAGQVTVSAERAGDELLIAVRDTGVGISEDDLPRIFERFYKADRARSDGGTGLGLAIARHIVQGHGGRIWAESVEGRGSTFFFTLRTALPAVSPSPPEVVGPAPADGP